MGFMFRDLHVSLNNPSSGDINSSNLPCCYLLLPLWESVIVLCFAVRYFMSILVLQSS